MADIAAVFHWTPADMAAFTINELIYWQKAAVTRWKTMNRKAE